MESVLPSSYHLEMSPTTVPVRFGMIHQRYVLIRLTVIYGLLLPDPLGPTIAVVFPALKHRLKSCRILTSCRDGYAKLMFLSSMSRSMQTSGSCKPTVLGFGASIMVKNIEAALRALDAAARGTEMALRCAIIVIVDSRTLPFVRSS
jgi:hypothetical protein